MFVRSAVTALVTLLSVTGLAAPSAVPAGAPVPAVPAVAAVPAAVPAGVPAAVPVSDQAFSFGVIGDIPYGAAEIAKFPARIQDINADGELKFVTHVGDIKNGSSICSDEYFQHTAPSSIPSSTR